MARQAFPFPISGEVYKVSYEKLLAKNLDTTQAQDLAHVVDTETYYQSQTQDGTTTGVCIIPCLSTRKKLLQDQFIPGCVLERAPKGCVGESMQQGHQRFRARMHRWATSHCQPACWSTT